FSSCDRIQRNDTAEKPVPVRLEKITQDMSSQPVICAGQVSAGEIVKLSFKTGGIISTIHVSEGQKVTEGQLLAQLDLTEIQAKVNQAKVGLEKAERDLERAQNLFDDDVIPLAQLQNARSAHDIALQDHNTAEFNLKHSEIRAPSEGVILKKLAEERELIAQGMPVFIFGSGEKSWIVKGGIVDRDLVRIAESDSARIELDAYPGELFSGFVSEIGEFPSPNSGVFEVEIILDETEFKLVTGLIAKVTIFPSKLEAMRLVPIESAVRIEGKTGFVFVPNEAGNTARKVTVEFGYIVDDKIAVKRGLEEISEVISEGALNLSEGSKIKIID
ncbi:MAG TPA: efflux RND transporter periplasmic adaptor subunit, partial [candidate division Zixibacteria bacterium]|nr:efflux RND transporter periplasmic adaptor subunit [candidate division Zixibacteria bacterium]